MGTIFLRFCHCAEFESLDVPESKDPTLKVRRTATDKHLIEVRWAEAIRGCLGTLVPPLLGFKLIDSILRNLYIQRHVVQACGFAPQIKVLKTIDLRIEALR